MATAKALAPIAVAGLTLTPWWKYPCPQRVLMVTDGSLNFGAGGFGLSEFVGIVQAAGHTVSTAHRSGFAPVSIAGAFNFATAAVGVTTANYDQIWLFGYSTSVLTPAEQTRIANFMNAGGGVFATGDHENLGWGMGNHIPRVRKMREWSAINGGNPFRLDTVVDPGQDGLFQFHDQSDTLPQRIFPVFFSNGGPANTASSWTVHPVLRASGGIVDYLPDHPHESECLEPAPVAGNFAGIEEWPAPAAGGARIPAKKVAISVSGGQFLTDNHKPPVYPRCFGAISAYDGDAANVGRVTCDATWHHFININLNGTGATPDSLGNARLGLYAAPAVPTPEYLKIQKYYLNTVRWLAPKNRRWCSIIHWFELLRLSPEMLELQLPHPHPCPWDLALNIGRVAESTLRDNVGQGAAEELVDELLRLVPANPALSRLLATQQNIGADAKGAPTEGDNHWLPLRPMRQFLLGSVVNAMAAQIPEDPAKQDAFFSKRSEKASLAVLRKALDGAHKVMAEKLDAALKNSAALLQAVKKGNAG